MLLLAIEAEEPNDKSLFPSEIFPFVNVRVPLAFSAVASTTPALLFNVRLLNVVGALPPMTCSLLPLNDIVLPVFVKVAPLFAQSPATVCV